MGKKNFFITPENEADFIKEALTNVSDPSTRIPTEMVTSFLNHLGKLLDQGELSDEDIEAEVRKLHDKLSGKAHV